MCNENPAATTTTTAATVTIELPQFPEQRDKSNTYLNQLIVNAYATAATGEQHALQRQETALQQQRPTATAVAAAIESESPFLNGEANTMAR
jgi:hypothetical protein